MSTIETRDIDTTLLYEGYLWLSNADKPIEYHYDKESDPGIFETLDPFVREGYLFNKKEAISLTIKHVDGRYLVRKFHIEKECDDQVEKVLFASNRMSRRWLTFLRYWEEQRAPSCLDLPELVFDRFVFVGFDD